MHPFCIVIGLNVFKYFLSSLSSCLKMSIINKLSL
uniref:DNA for the transposon-like element on the lactose plasmid n=1 Tax=Lactococcus lactis TaxID=1358 RepID=Q99392_9LACT|nr:unnamed protein product [Lactococcus lactis]